MKTSLEIVESLRQRRKALNISQEYLAELAGLGIQTVKQIELHASNPKLATLLKIADVLGMELSVEIRQIQ